MKIKKSNNNYTIHCNEEEIKALRIGTDKYGAYCNKKWGVKAYYTTEYIKEIKMIENMVNEFVSALEKKPE